MNYKVVYTQTAFDDIKKLDTILRKRIKKKIEAYMSQPLSFAKGLSHSSIGMYRWRIGNYRVVFDIDGSTIIILRIGHRREIYR